MRALSLGVFVVVLMQPDHNKVLLLRRKNTRVYDGKFSIPGGTRKNKESWPKAAARELHEETGLIVESHALQPLDRLEGVDPDGTEWLSTFYVAESWAGQLQTQKEPEKHDMLDWYPIDNLPTNTVPAVRKIIVDLVDNYAPYRAPVRQSSVSNVINSSATFRKYSIVRNYLKTKSVNTMLSLQRYGRRIERAMIPTQGVIELNKQRV